MNAVQYSLISVLQKVSCLKEQKDTSDKLKNLLCISQYLKDHPVLQESVAYKIQYLSVLDYFVKNYSKNSIFSASALDHYKHVFLGDQYFSYQYMCSDLKKAAKKVACARFRTFKLFSYRYILLLDIVFLCAFDDADKANCIFKQVKLIFHPRYHANIDNLYKVLYHAATPSKRLSATSNQLLCWAKDKSYFSKPMSTVLFVANMSAGKSTLINAIVGKKVNKSLGQACTAKLHYIISKAFEDGYTYEYDYLLDLNADYDTLMDDNVNNSSNEIMVGTAFRFITPPNKRICFLDTPGANYSRNKTHREISYGAIDNGNYDTLVYVFAAGTTGTDGEREYLTYIKEHYKDCELIFVINKLDEYKDGEDSVDVSIEKADADLKNIGFTDYQLYPVSGYAGFLAKRVIWGENFTPPDADFFALMRCKARFNTPGFDFSKYFHVPDEIIDLAGQAYAGKQEEFDLLVRSGMFGLEYVLTH